MTLGTGRNIGCGIWDIITTSFSRIIRCNRCRKSIASTPIKKRIINYHYWRGAASSPTGFLLLKSFTRPFPSKLPLKSVSSPWPTSRSKPKRFFTFSFPISRHHLHNSIPPRHVLSRGFATSLIAWQAGPVGAAPTATAAAAQTTESIIVQRINILSSSLEVGSSHEKGDLRRVRTKCGGSWITRLAREGWRRCISSSTGGKKKGNGNGGRRRKVDRVGHGDGGKSSGISTSSAAGEQSRSVSPGKLSNGSGSGKKGEVPKKSNGREKDMAQSKKPRTQEQKGGNSNEQDTGILGRIAQMHRPTKDRMLAAATGAFERLRIRTKWAMIRQMRPYNLEDIMAFFSWLFVGHVLWIVLGTTTFFSIALLLVNTIYAQEKLAGVVGNYLTKETGVKVVFESAIVPRWKDGTISVRNVFVSRRPGHSKTSKSNVQKGSSATVAAAAAAAAHSPGKDNPSISIVEPHEEDESTKYTQFDLTIEEISVTLSLAKWMNGKGLLKDVDVKGVRGVIDRRFVEWKEGEDPRSHKNVHQPGDFEIENFKLEDLLVTIYQPDGLRPFSMSIFQCDLPQLRKQWLFYDILSANNMSGSYDDSLFTVHRRQSHGVPPSQQLSGSSEDGFAWKKMSRLRIDGLAIDQLNRGIEGPFGWIQEGTVDFVADIMFPEESDDLVFAKVVQDIAARVGEGLSNTTSQILPYPQKRTVAIRNSSEYYETASTLLYTNAADPENRNRTTNTATNTTTTMENNDSSHNNDYDNEDSSNSNNSNRGTARDDLIVIFDLRLTLNNPRATVPIFTRDLSYVNQALIRPIVAYINSRRTYIPIHCRVVKRLSDFDGSWTTFDCGLMDDLSAGLYKAFARTVVDRQARRRRFRKVGLWTLQIIVQALLMAVTGKVI